MSVFRKISCAIISCLLLNANNNNDKYSAAKKHGYVSLTGFVIPFPKYISADQ